MRMCVPAKDPGAAGAAPMSYLTIMAPDISLLHAVTSFVNM